MFVDELGDGPPVVLVHGNVTSGRATWAGQLSLARRWRLHVLTRRGYHPDAPTDEREDFDHDAAELARWLGRLAEPVHLVGHSYGGLVALLAAAQRPDLVRSLVLSEPTAFRVAEDVPAVLAFVAGMRELWRTGPADPAEFLRAFLAAAGAPAPPDPLPAPLAQNARVLRTERGPWEAELPLEALTGVPALVLSGGHSAVFDVVCDRVAAAVGAERAVVAGAGHSVQAQAGDYNDLVEEFWLAH